MPAVSALLSSGVSVGLLAGVVSGLLYLVVAGLRWAGEAKQQTNHWLYRQARGRYLPAAPSDGAIEPYNGDGMEPEYVRVREFIERLVESMVLGELDNVCIKRLHAHPEYKHMADDDSPSAAHAALKQLVQQIVRDAMTLPNFRGLNHTRDSDECHSEDIDSKTYEDLLATAILNKVIERYQESSGSDRRTVDGNSNLLTPELMSLISTRQPKFISSVEIGINSTSPDDERTLSSDDCERSFDPLSLTIEECIEEEVTTVSNVEDDENDEDADFDVLGVFKNRRTPFPEYGRDIIDDLLITNPEDDVDEDEEDDADSSDDDPSLQPTDVINPVDSWEKNWLFQKRRLKVGGVSQPMPVPMLVPNPSEDFRALIGDRDAEDVSDLSECSDGALEDLVLADVDDSSRNVLPSEVNTKDMCAEWIPDVDTQGDFNSVCRNNSPLEVKQCSEKSKNILLNNAPNGISSSDDLQVTEAKNTDIYKTSAEDCISEFDQQEGEYTEDYAAVTQRQLDSLSGLSDPDLQSVPELPASPVPPQSSEQSETASLLNEIMREESENMESPDEMLSKSELGRPPKIGTIAEREHRKWETAPPLPNNPYSPENIQKRLNKKQMYAGISNGNGADIAIDFPELNENSSKTVIDKPVHIVCSPSDVDYKRYGRDYYINTSATSKKQPRNSSEPHLQSLTYEEDSSSLNRGENYAFHDTNGKNDDCTEHESENEFSLVETKVAHWQKEINETNEYYQNLKTKKQNLPQISSEHADSSSFIKSMLSDVEEENEIKSGSARNHMKQTTKEYDRKEDNFKGTGDEHRRYVPKESKTSKKHGSDSYSDTSDHMMFLFNKYDSGRNNLMNGSTRSNSPSGSSVLTSDSEFNMPSVRELTKRFSSIADSESSASSKSTSPAPKWRNNEKEIDSVDSSDTRSELSSAQAYLNVPRPTREIHSLTARSISREFREELRHNQPTHLNRNVYRQPGKSDSNASSLETTTSEGLSRKQTSQSPLPIRSTQSTIAFWEKLQKHNT